MTGHYLEKSSKHKLKKSSYLGLEAVSLSLSSLREPKQLQKFAVPSGVLDPQILATSFLLYFTLALGASFLRNLNPLGRIWSSKMVGLTDSRCDSEPLGACFLARLFLHRFFIDFLGIWKGFGMILEGQIAQKIDIFGSFGKACLLTLIWVAFH